MTTICSHDKKTFSLLISNTKYFQTNDKAVNIFTFIKQGERKLHTFVAPLEREGQSGEIVFRDKQKARKYLIFVKR